MAAEAADLHFAFLLPSGTAPLTAQGFHPVRSDAAEETGRRCVCKNATEAALGTNCAEVAAVKVFDEPVPVLVCEGNGVGEFGQHHAHLRRWRPVGWAETAGEGELFFRRTRLPYLKAVQKRAPVVVVGFGMAEGLLHRADEFADGVCVGHLGKKPRNLAQRKRAFGVQVLSTCDVTAL